MSLIRSSFSRPPAGARRRWRRGPAVAAMLAAVAFFAAPAASGATTASAASPAAPARQLSTNQGGSSLCMNQDGGGTSQGTFIIGYNCGYQNNYFEYVVIENECNLGKVTVSPACPFDDTALDSYYDGADIVEVYNPNSNLCAGTSESTTFTLRLEECPTSPPAGWNSILVAPGASTNTPDCLISVHSTNEYARSNEIYVAQTQGYTKGIAFTSVSNYTSGCPLSAQWYTVSG